MRIALSLGIGQAVTVDRTDGQGCMGPEVTTRGVFVDGLPKSGQLVMTASTACEFARALLLAAGSK